MFTLSYRRPYETRRVRRRTEVDSSVRAAWKTRVFSITAAVIVLLLLCLTRVIGQHEILRESRCFTEIGNISI